LGDCSWDFGSSFELLEKIRKEKLGAGFWRQVAKKTLFRMKPDFA
jgi:hypothetical protein